MRMSKRRSLAPSPSAGPAASTASSMRWAKAARMASLPGKVARNSASETSAASAISARPTATKSRSATSVMKASMMRSRGLGGTPPSRPRLAAAPGGLLAFRSRCHGITSFPGLVWRQCRPRSWPRRGFPTAQPESSRERFFAAATAFFISGARPFLAISTLSAASVVPLGEVTFLRNCSGGRSER